MAESRKKRGFTLIELLIVIAVIGILVGLVLPLVGGMGERALDSQAKDLCSQVADAWKILAMRETRLPSTDLLDEMSVKTEIGGDFAYQMTPAMGYLLNEWHCTTPIPAADKARFHPKKPNKPPHVFDPRVRRGVCPTEDDLVDYDLVDAVLERDDLQKRFGVFAPWVRRKFNDAAEEAARNAPDEPVVLLHELCAGQVVPRLRRPDQGILLRLHQRRFRICRFMVTVVPFPGFERTDSLSMKLSMIVKPMPLRSSPPVL